MRSARFPACLVLVLLAVSVSCTEPTSKDTTPTSSASPQLETPTGGFLYTAPGLEATLELTGEHGTLVVLNRTGVSVGAPRVYLLDAVDGRRFDGQTEDRAPIPDGETRTFEVSVPGAPAHDDIGLVVLLLGGKNFGAFVPAELA